MYTHIGKFDQRITPTSDTVYITQSAIGRSVDRESRDDNFKRKKKKKDGFQDHEEDTVVLSTDGQAIAADIFDEHDEAWISIASLLTNARARLDAVADVLMKRQLLVDGMDSDGMDDETPEKAPEASFSVDPSIQKAIKAYQNQKDFGHTVSTQDMSSQQKQSIQEAVQQESTEDLEEEKANLLALIPGLETLLKNDYTHMPLLANTPFLETVNAALTKIDQSEESSPST